MTVMTEKSGEVMVVTISGRIDAATSPQLGEVLARLVDARETRLLIDMAGVDYVSSAGLAVLFTYMQKLGSGNGKMAFSALSERVEELFYVVGFHSLISLYRTREEGLARLSC